MCDSSSGNEASSGVQGQTTSPASQEGDKALGRAGSEGSSTGFWNVAHSVGAGLLGVQSRKNRERDFTQGNPVHFIIGGVIGTLLFILAIWIFVKYLIATS